MGGLFHYLIYAPRLQRSPAAGRAMPRTLLALLTLSLAFGFSLGSGSGFGFARIALAQTAPTDRVQPESADPEIAAAPICQIIRNKAPFQVYGDISTNYYTRPDGTRARHWKSFKIKPDGPDSFVQFCTQGPFYPGGRVALSLRTLIPVFQCQTTLEREIVIQGRRKAEGGTEMWIDCQ